MRQEINIKCIDELPKVAHQLLEYIKSGNYNIIEFYGSMGAGKTTLIREMCSQLGVIDVVTSPTFAIINEYKMTSGEQCFHFDFYRINKIQEVLDMGYEEYFYSGNLCLIEWPELIEELLPQDDDEIKNLKIEIEQTEGNGRRFRF